MNRTRFVEHKGKKILHVDFSGCGSAELAPAIEEAKAAIKNLPPASAFLLTDVTNTEISRTTSAMIKDFSSHNTPYVAASAVVGVQHRGGTHRPVHFPVRHHRAGQGLAG